tara:strand:+ start:12992 stop:13153 length:162 start_codon:yes stop_codon:yes gene_type:complete
MSLLEKFYDTFLENTVEGIAENVKEKVVVSAPYLFAAAFVLTGALVIFRRLGR